MRVIAVDDPAYPGFCRIVVNRHVAEMTDLSEDERACVMGAVFAVETAVRELVRPDKVNLASLGNVVPHVHWHVIPRFREDRHFPGSIWSAPLREAAPRATVSLEALAVAITAQLGRSGT